jgi:hypothetical protein
MPGLVPGIHGLLYELDKDVDGRDKPGHDEKARDMRHAIRRMVSRSNNG